MTFKKLTTIFLFVCISAQSFGQQKTLIDSTFAYLEDKYYEFKEIDSIRAKIYADLFYEKAITEKDTIKMIYAYSYKSQILKNDSIYLNYLDSLINVTKSLPSSRFPVLAYIKKGRYYVLREEIDKALENYLNSLSFAKLNENDSLINIIKQRIAVIEGINGNYTTEKKLYLEVYNYYSLYYDKIDLDNYYSLLHNISTLYSKLNLLDSASYYNIKSYELSTNFNDTILKAYSTYRQGMIEYQLENYSSAIDSLIKTPNRLILDQNFRLLSKVYTYIAKSYGKLNNKQNQLKYYTLVDSLFKQNGIIHLPQKEVYIYLVKYYAKTKDYKKQLHFIENLLKIDSTLNTRKENTNKSFFDNYEKPKLLAEREEIIKKLQSESSATIYSLIGISVIVLFLFGFQHRKRKQLKQRFEEIVKNKEKQETEHRAQEPKESLSIPKEVIKKVLEGLGGFENGTSFTSPKLSLHSLANDLNTNANYLSKIINHYKGFGFSAYINSLRVNHVIQLLDTDSRIRKYSIKGIAEEMGYKNAESFSNAFYKKTGLKPSYYIKQLEKLEG